MQQIKGLDTLRAFAVFFVIIEHFGVWFDDTSFSGRLIKTVLIPDGGFGVDLFFVLSGFLITSILFNAKHADHNRKPFVIIKNFFIRRALRIFPVYYMLLVLLYIVNYPGLREHIGYYLSYTANILCYRTNSWNSFSHTWTLDVEEQFYLLWPWLVIFINDRYFKYVAIAAIFTGIISTYIAMNVLRHIGPLLVLNCIDAFAIGGFYAWARQNEQAGKLFTGAINKMGLIALAMYFYWKISVFCGYNSYGLFMSKTANSLVAIWLIIAVIKNKSEWIRKYILENRFLNYIGKISYGIYLYHYVYINGYCNPFNHWLYNITLPYPSFNRVIHDHHCDYWIEVSIIILIAAVSYKLIEKPLLSLKGRFNYTRGKLFTSAEDRTTNL